MISLDEFRRVELRVGEIVAAEPLPGSDRLLKLTVDLGEETRVVVGGLGRSYRPEDLRGLQVVVAANLMPARIRGVESQGMLLGVGCENAKDVALVTINRAVRNGAVVV